MIIPDKKKMATMIVAHLHGAPEESQDGDEGGDDASYHAIAEDLLKAFEDKDVSGIVSALKAFHAECEGDEDLEGDYPEGD